MNNANFSQVNFNHILYSLKVLIIFTSTVLPYRISKISCWFFLKAKSGSGVVVHSKTETQEKGKPGTLFPILQLAQPSPNIGLLAYNTVAS